MELGRGYSNLPENAPDTLLFDGEILGLYIALLPEPNVHALYAGSATEGCHSPAKDAFFPKLVSGV